MADLMGHQNTVAVLPATYPSACTQDQCMNEKNLSLLQIYFNILMKNIVSDASLKNKPTINYKF